MIHRLLEPLIFPFDDIFKEKRKPLILHFRLLHVITLLVIFAVWGRDYNIFMRCVVWRCMVGIVKIEYALLLVNLVAMGII